MKYRLNEPICGQAEKQLLNEVIDSNYLGINGKYTKLFEQEFAARHKMSYGLAVQSGTAAVHIALVALGVQPGDYVAIPSFTCSGSYTPVLQLGVTPVVIDVDAKTFGMSSEEFMIADEKYRFKAVIIVHVYGQPAQDTDIIREYCKANEILVIEDCSEAHGAQLYHNVPVGCMSDAAAFSIRSEKLIGVGEGGIVLFNSDQHYERGYWFANRCKGLEDKGWAYKYFTNDIGCNYLMPHLLGAMAYAQLQRLNGFIDRRREIKTLYRKRLPQFNWQQQNSMNASFWLNYVMFPVHVFLNKPLNNIVEWIGEDLMAQGVEIRPGFWPAHRQPIAGIELSKPVNYIWEADKISQTGLCLPSHPNLTDNDILDICKLVESCWNKYNVSNK